MHFAIERLNQLVSEQHTVGYCPNKLLLDTDSGDLFHLFVYKTSCYKHLHESGIQPDVASYLVNFSCTRRLQFGMRYLSLSPPKDSLLSFKAALKTHLCASAYT